jgi:hypothetical protein
MKTPRLEDIEAGASRRVFLRRLVVGGSLALGAGGVVAYLVDRDNTTVMVLPNGDAVEVPTGTEVDETMNLINELAALREELSASDAARRDAESQLSNAQAEIARLNDENSGLLSLVGLYEALEAIGLDDLVAVGFATIGAGMVAARQLISLLEKGVGKGITILDEFAEHFPTPQEGLVWLAGQLSALIINLQTLTARIEEAIEPIEDFAQEVAEFIVSVLRRLPFGHSFAGGLETMQTIVGGLPTMVADIRTGVLDPLDEWFGQNNQTNLLGTLVNPMEEELIGPADDIVTSFGELDDSYQSDLLTPVQGALDERATIRQQIEAQRAQLSGVLMARTRHTTNS